jgi:hypothetical protein
LFPLFNLFRKYQPTFVYPGRIRSHDPNARQWRRPGLPDGLFSNQKYQLGQILEGLKWDDIDSFMAIWNIYGHF